MPECPICAKPLETVRQREGLYYDCRTCNGRALTLPQVRRVTGDRFAARLTRLVALSRRRVEHACPFCRQRMLAVQTSEPPLQLEACRPCSIVWFDAPSYEALPEGIVESTNAIPLLATEIVALSRLKDMKDREEQAERDKRKKKRRTL